jgi:hypothetical protein
MVQSFFNKKPTSLIQHFYYFMFEGSLDLFRSSGLSIMGVMDDVLTVAGKTFRSRLFVGTGKYRSKALMARCHEASGTEMVTLAVRRVNLTDRSKESELDFIDRSKIFILPNTAGCYTADEAIRTARLAREVGLSNWIKLEVIGDQKTLFPDNEGLLGATRVLVKEGFVVLPYTTDDLVNARKLIDAGAAAVMPLAAPIGSGLGIRCLDSDGAWLRWCAAEHSHRRSGQLRADGSRYEACGRSGASRLPGWKDAETCLCRRQQPRGRDNRALTPALPDKRKRRKNRGWRHSGASQRHSYAAS